MEAVLRAAQESLGHSLRALGPGERASRDTWRAQVDPLGEMTGSMTLFVRDQAEVRALAAALHERAVAVGECVVSMTVQDDVIEVENLRSKSGRRGPRTRGGPAAPTTNTSGC